MTTPVAVAHFRAPQVAGLAHDTQDLLDRLVAVWRQKLPRNSLRSLYVDMKNRTRDLGISIPPALRDLEIVMGWGEKAVYGLAQRCIWDGVVAPSGVDDPFELRSVLRDNRFDIELPQAIVSQLTHSVSFISTTPGDVQSGEPEVLIMAHSAMWSAGLWDRRRRALSGLLLVGQTDDLGRPTELTILTPWETVACVQGPSGQWYVQDVRHNPLGRVLAEPMPFRPTLDRPFGRSRINRQVMSIIDRATRAGLRLDVHGEFFSAAQFLLFGAAEDAFTDDNGNPIPMWDWYIGRFKTLSRDEDGELPQLQEIAQKDPTPHITTMRQLAGEFSGATSLALSSLGITAENPESAEAMYAAKEDLVIEATNNNRVNDAALSRVFQNTVMLRDGLTEAPSELEAIGSRWANPALPSVVSASDAMVKQIAAIPRLAESDVALEELGYSEEQILRLRADWRRKDDEDTMATLMAGRGVAQAASSESPAEVKARADAMGVFIRAGVKPDDAARLAGVAGVSFTGMVPVALRSPETSDPTAVK